MLSGQRQSVNAYYVLFALRKVRFISQLPNSEEEGAMPQPLWWPEEGPFHAPLCSGRGRPR